MRLACQRLKISLPLTPYHKSEEGFFPLRVSVETEKKQNVIVTVLDSNGLLVRRLYQGRN